MSYNTFPTFIGAGWDIKKRIITSTGIEEATNGSEFITSKYSKPHYEFDLTWNYLSQVDKDALEDFITSQLGPGVPFYLSVLNDNSFTDKVCTPVANGTNKVFTIPLRAQSFLTSTTSVKDNGAAAGANTVDATVGTITFTTAPVSGHVITWSGNYVYLVRFSEDSQEINQLWNQGYEQGGITFRTRR